MYRLRRSTAMALTFSAVLLAAGCGGRGAKPVALETPLDDQLTCEHLLAEYSVNRVKIEDLNEERQRAIYNNSRQTLNTWTLIDIKKTERKEIAALQARNEMVQQLLSKKNCF